MHTMESDLAVLCLPQSLFRFISKAEFDSQVSCTQQTWTLWCHACNSPMCRTRRICVRIFRRNRKQIRKVFWLFFTVSGGFHSILLLYNTVQQRQILKSRPFAGAENFWRDTAWGTEISGTLDNLLLPLHSVIWNALLVPVHPVI